jgi:3-(3-hydroxy-phenyl)propionate hydroxylase
VLELASSQLFARPLVNSGRLSKPTPYLNSSLNTQDTQDFQGGMLPGTNCADAPVTVNGQGGWFLNQLSSGFTLLSFGAGATPVQIGNIRAKVLEEGKDLIDIKGLLKTRFDGQPGTVYLIRPDQHVAARWRHFDANAIKEAMQRTLKVSA